MPAKQISYLRHGDIISVPVLIASDGLQVVVGGFGADKLLPLDLLNGKGSMEYLNMPQSEIDKSSRQLSFLEENEWSYRGKLVLKFCAELEL